MSNRVDDIEKITKEALILVLFQLLYFDFWDRTLLSGSGLTGKSACHQAWWCEFMSWDLHVRRRERTNSFKLSCLPDGYYGTLKIQLRIEFLPSMQKAVGLISRITTNKTSQLTWVPTVCLSKIHINFCCYHSIKYCNCAWKVPVHVAFVSIWEDSLSSKLCISTESDFCFCIHVL